MTGIASDQRPPGQDYLVRRIADLEREVRELQAAWQSSPPRLVTATGTTPVTASTPAADRDFEVVLSPPLSGTGYTPHVTFRGDPAAIAGHAVLGAEVVDEQTVRVSVRSAALSTTGADLYVIAQEVVR